LLVGRKRPEQRTTRTNLNGNVVFQEKEHGENNHRPVSPVKGKTGQNQPSDETHKLNQSEDHHAD